MNIAVIGTGYVGLVTGTCFAEAGNEVTCVDIDDSKVAAMKAGKIPIYEPDLGQLFERNIREGRLHFTTKLAEGIKKAEVIFLALPTPPAQDGSADLSFILGVADELGSLIKRYVVVVDKSTVPVGTAERVKKHIAKKAKVDFDVVSNPEFLREGFAVSDFLEPDRVVIGTSSVRAKKVMNDLYQPFIRQGNNIFFMDERSAEMTKYAANSFLATKISFMNEVANVCELVGADVDAVRIGIGSDERIGKRFLFPGIGYGGSCFPKDVLALQHTASDEGYEFKILAAVTQVNNEQKRIMVRKVLRHFKGDIEGKHFGLWGLAFKPDTDDIREAPSLEIIKELTQLGAEVTAYDPEAVENVKRQIGNNKGLHYVADEYEAAKNMDALIIATEWSSFRTPDFNRLKKLLKQPIIFDGRNLYELDNIRKYGFHYESIGRTIISG